MFLSYKNFLFYNDFSKKYLVYSNLSQSWYFCQKFHMSSLFKDEYFSLTLLDAVFDFCGRGGEVHTVPGYDSGLPGPISSQFFCHQI